MRRRARFALAVVLIAALFGAAVARAAPPAVYPVAGTSVLSGVACTSASSCLAVGATASFLTVVVPISHGVPGSAVVGSEHARLRAIACVSASSCVAVGGGPGGKGVVVPVSNGVPGTAQPVPGTGFLSDVACDPSGACIASGINEQFSEGVVVPISEGVAGTSSAVPFTSTLSAITCPAVGSCLAVGSGIGGAVIVPINGGTPQPAEPVAAAAPLELSDIDCPSASTCTAAGLAFFPNAAGLASVPVLSGAPGSARITPNVPTAAIGVQPFAVSCPSTELCLVAGGGFVPISGAVSPIVAGAPGNGQSIPGTATPRDPGLNDVVCTRRKCVAVGQTSGGEGVVLSFSSGSGAPATTAVSIEPTSSWFGRPVIATVTVSSSAGTPTGQVYFAIDGVFTDYPQTLDGSGHTVFSARGLAPGSHTITAAYLGPAGTFSPGGTFFEPGSATASINVTCATTITGEQNQSLSISQSATCISGAHVSGSITVNRGVSVAIDSSTISGEISAERAGAFRMCASTVGGALSITGASGYVLVGDRAPKEDFDGCAANTIHGSLNLINDANGLTAIANGVGSINPVHDSGRGDYPFELAPALAPNTLLASGQSTFLATRQTGAQGQTVDGIECNGSEQLVSHYHAHLAIFANGQPLAVPEGIGMVGPLFEEITPYGPFASPEGGCIYWVHVHDQSGMIHMELPAAFTVTLGDFFDLWGQPLSSSQVGPQQGKVIALVDGSRYTGDPRSIVLGDHSLVQLDIGTPKVPPQPFQFTAINP